MGTCCLVGICCLAQGTQLGAHHRPRGWDGEEDRTEAQKGGGVYVHTADCAAETNTTL